MSLKKDKLKVYGMTCTSCEGRIERALKALPGVTYAKADYTNQFVEVEFDPEACNISTIKGAVTKAGYTTEKSSDFKLIGIFIIVAAVIMLGMSTQGIDMESKLQNASYLVLFVVGILTSLHCVGMCGGIMLSQTINKDSNGKFSAIKPALLYNLGRVTSYTILGGIIGALGSVLSLSLTAKSFLQIFAGLFMIIMGLNMTGFPLFRKIHIRLPWSTCAAKNKNKAPFIIGLLNGFMPCGPLQTMQLYALGTGSAFAGAASMFMFSIGTVPLMLTFGALSGILSKGFTKSLLKFSGVLIIVLGLIMGNRGLALSGININPLSAIMSAKNQKVAGSNTAAAGSKATLENGVQTLNMTADARGYSPAVLYVKKGVPVKWIVDGKQLTSCNNSLVVPSLNIQKKLKSGENIIEFTPVKTGDINFSCWMGMIRGVVKVVDDLGTVDSSKSADAIPAAPAGGSCCGGGAGAVPSTPGVYGDDLSKVPTDQLINKALNAGKLQSAKIKGIGYDLQPLIVVISKDNPSKIIFDFTEYDNAEGKYDIVDATSGNVITSFTAKKGVNELEFKAPKAGGYGITKSGNLLGIIEAVDDLKTVDLEKIRAKYLQ